MNKYPTVEDYLEVIAGLRDPVTGKKTATHNWFNAFEPIVNLARYDTDVLNSMSTTASEGRALTEKQGELAVKIVLKYKKQLAAKSIDVASMETPVWRLPLRKLDYTRSMVIKNDQIVVQFPFNNELIEDLRTFRKDSQGHGEWDKDAKVWRFALTEYNLVWLSTWGEQKQFEFDTEITRLNALVTEVESVPFAIELQYVNDELVISNCPESLHNYVVNNLGGFGTDNIMRLVDTCSVLGYTVSKTIADMTVANTTPRFYNLAINREIKLDPTAVADDLASVLDYADRVERWPVVVYEPDMSGRLLAQLKQLREGVVEVARTVKTNEGYWDTGFRYVHVVTPVINKKIPLLISSAGMIYGGDKSLMVQNSEKVVYCSADVYNKAGQTKVPTIAS
jgi:hypothetical protein